MLRAGKVKTEKQISLQNSLKIWEKKLQLDTINIDYTTKFALLFNVFRKYTRYYTSSCSQ